MSKFVCVWLAILVLLTPAPVLAQDPTPDDPGIRRPDGPNVYRGLPPEGLQPIEYDESSDIGLEQPIGFDELWFMGRIGLTVYQLIEANDAWPIIITFVLVLLAVAALIKLISDMKYKEF